MKKFTMLLFGAILVALITGYVESVSADHLEPGQGIFKNENDVELADTKNTNYQVYLQSILRNGDGHLISIIESTANAGHIPHEITDHVFDTLMGEKEIIIIDNIKYEKVQYKFNPTLEQRFMTIYPIFSEVTLEYKMEKDVLTKMKSSQRNYNVWKIHYCAEFDGHGYRCIPIFQVLVPTITLEPHDVVTHQWTILRELN